MNIGIVGAGFTASMHARLYQDIESAKLIGITCKTNARAKETAEKHQIRCFTDYKEMLDDPSIDIIDICTPTNTHALIAAESMKMGKQVILEYPAISSTSELHELQTVSRQTSRCCALAYYSRFQSQYSYLFDEASSLKLGKVTSVTIARKCSSIFTSEDLVNNLISQDIDFVVRLLGKPQRIQAAHAKQDYAVFYFEYNGASAVIEGAVNMHEGFPFTTHHSISGTEGSIDLLWRFPGKPEYSMTQTSREGIRNIVNVDYDPYRRELEIILEGLASGNTSSFDLDSAADGMEVSFACREMIK